MLATAVAATHLPVFSSFGFLAISRIAVKTIKNISFPKDVQGVNLIASPKHPQSVTLLK